MRLYRRNISALGEPTLSEWAALFNWDWGLRVGGVLLMGVRVGLGGSVRHWSMLPVTIAGVLLAAGVVGLCGGDGLGTHPLGLSERHPPSHAAACSGEQPVCGTLWTMES